jgi:glycosyltransferase involved in cell wall biosynthesis
LRSSGGAEFEACAGREPWVLVAGGFHARGGMDKANAALAAYLLGRGHEVHLVAHEVSGELSSHPRANVHLAPRPAGSVLLGEHYLSRLGRRVAREVRARRPRARVVANGGNCVSTDVNWVHAVHHAWPPADSGAPLWFRAKNRLWHLRARRRERRALGAARFVVANSERTRRDLVERVGLDASRVRVVYLASEMRGEATAAERAAARERLGVAGGDPVVVFVGALGHDRNKGFDTLWRAWRLLSGRGGWDARLLVAGGGRGFERWQGRMDEAGLGARVRLLGFTERVDDVYAAADLLVSPARYEAYGLNVHEAVSRGAAALVSARSGVAELFPASLDAMLLPDPEDADDLARRLAAWRAEPDAWRERFRPLASSLRRRAWDDMAAELVSFAESVEAPVEVEGSARAAHAV